MHKFFKKQIFYPSRFAERRVCFPKPTKTQHTGTSSIRKALNQNTCNKSKRLCRHRRTYQKDIRAFTHRMPVLPSTPATGIRPWPLFPLLQHPLCVSLSPSSGTIIQGSTATAMKALSDQHLRQGWIGRFFHEPETT